MAYLLDLLYALAVGLFWPYLLYRRWKRGPAGVPLGEYFGRVPSRPVSARCVWIHGVSLGEINATRTIVEELRRRSPDTIMVLSSTTRTGLDRAREFCPQNLVFRFPLDFSFAIRTLLSRIRPSIIVLMELEVWPNLLEVAAARGIPVIIANGRITEERSLRRFKRPVIRWLARASHRMTGRLNRRRLRSSVIRPLAMITGMPRAAATSRRLGQTSSSIKTMIDGRMRLSRVRMANEKSSGKRKTRFCGQNSRARSSPVRVVLLSTMIVSGERRRNSSTIVRVALISPSDTPWIHTQRAETGRDGTRPKYSPSGTPAGPRFHRR